MGKDNTPPPAPDYTGAAREQGEQNIHAAQVGAELNRVNTNTPYGTLNYSQPDKENSPNQWQADVTLSPDQQKLLDYQTGGQIGKASAADNMLGRVGQATASPLDTRGIPTAVGSVRAPDLNMYSGDPNTASQLDASGVPKLNTDWGDQAKQAQDAAYAQQTSMLDPQYKQQEEATRARLAASGATEGSEGFTNAMTALNNQKATDYGNARNAAIGIGNNEQATLAGESLAGNNQLYGQALNTGGFNNSAKQTNYGNAASASALNNATAQNQFGMNTSAANFQNTARGQQLTEAEALRELPLNEYNALTTGNQVTQPNFNVGTAQVNSPQAGNYQAAAQQAGANAMDVYNQGVATNNSNTQAGAGVATAAIMAYMF